MGKLKILYRKGDYSVCGGVQDDYIAHLTLRIAEVEKQRESFAKKIETSFSEAKEERWAFDKHVTELEKEVAQEKERHFQTKLDRDERLAALSDHLRTERKTDENYIKSLRKTIEQHRLD